MTEYGADDIRRGSVRETPPDTYPRGSEPLQLPDRRHDSTVVGVHDAGVATDQCGNRNRFGRRKGEIVEHASIRHLVHFPDVSSYRPSRFEPLRQSLPGARIEVVAKTKELVALNRSREVERLRAYTYPLSGSGLPFAVIIA